MQAAVNGAPGSASWLQANPGAVVAWLSFSAKLVSHMAATASRPVDLDEIVRRVIEVARPDRIILFGSAARGQMGPDSDIDLLVIKGGIASRRTLAQQIYVHLFGVPAPVAVIVVTPEDVERFRDRVGSIIGPALREGKEVYAA